MINKNMIMNNCNNFILTPDYLFVAQIMYAIEQKVSLLVCDPNEVDYNFRYAELTKDLK
jgi:hypothetical protein